MARLGLVKLPSLFLILGIAATVLCSVDIDPGSDILLHTGDSAYFGCLGTTDSNNSFVAGIHIYKMQRSATTPSNERLSNATGLNKVLLATSSIKGYVDRVFAGKKWKVSYSQDSAFSVKLYVNASDLKPQDSGYYICAFDYNTANQSEVTVLSDPIEISVVDRTPDVYVNLTLSASIINSTFGEVLINSTNVDNLTVVCSATATPLEPDAQLWINGNNVMLNAARTINYTMIGNTTGLQLMRTTVIISHTIRVDSLLGCTTVRCSGYIPKYKGLAELAWEQLTVKRSPQDCNSKGNEKLPISSGSVAATNQLETLLVILLGISKVLALGYLARG